MLIQVHVKQRGLAQIIKFIESDFRTKPEDPEAWSYLKWSSFCLQDSSYITLLVTYDQWINLYDWQEEAVSEKFDKDGEQDPMLGHDS